MPIRSIINYKMNNLNYYSDEDDNYYSADEEVTNVISFCGNEQHHRGVCPGDDWTKKKVKKTCDHHDLICWVRSRVINVSDYIKCDDVLHISTKDIKTQPDERIWIKKRVKKSCEHRDKTCWVLHLTKKEVYTMIRSKS